MIQGKTLQKENKDWKRKLVAAKKAQKYMNVKKKKNKKEKLDQLIYTLI